MSDLRSKIDNLKSKIASLFRRRRHGRLVRHYFLISLLLIAGGLISSAALEIYFRYRESQEQIALLEREAAAVAALKIERFVQEIVAAIKSSSKSREVMQSRVSPVTPADKVYAWFWFGWGFVLFQQDCAPLRDDCVKHAEKTPRRLLVLDDLA